jgi:hypothetical protein
MWEWDVITGNAAASAQKTAALDPSGWTGIAYPGPDSAAINAVALAFVPTDMVASVLSGDATPPEAVKTAQERAVQIFKEFGLPGER